MAEYWKSTPKYWCKFCEIYVRDTGIERKNHESSGKHQGNVQRSLRELHKGQARQQQDAQKAKNEVARLNNLVGGKRAPAPTTSSRPAPITQPRPPPRIDPGPVDYAAHRRAQAEQLAAMGLPIPDALKEDVTGVGEWQTVSQTVIDDDQGLSAYDPNDPSARIKGVHKRKLEDDEDEAAADQPTTSKRKAWGSSFKSYPGKASNDDDATDDLDALLNGVSKKQSAPIASPGVQTVADNDDTVVKNEGSTVTAPADDLEVKQEDESAITAPPVVTFKKRKGKR